MGIPHGGFARHPAGTFYPEVWDVVERGANFMLPAALLYLTYVLRRPAQLVEHEERPAKAELIGAERDRRDHSQ